MLSGSVRSHHSTFTSTPGHFRPLRSTTFLLRPSDTLLLPMRVSVKLCLPNRGGLEPAANYCLAIVGRSPSGVPARPAVISVRTGENTPPEATASIRTSFCKSDDKAGRSIDLQLYFADADAPGDRLSFSFRLPRKKGRGVPRTEFGTARTALRRGPHDADRNGKRPRRRRGDFGIPGDCRRYGCCDGTFSQPCRDVLNVRIPDAEGDFPIRFHNAAGQQVLATQVSVRAGDNGNTGRIDVSGLSPGTYSCTVECRGPANSTAISSNDNRKHHVYLPINQILFRDISFSRQAVMRRKPRPLMPGIMPFLGLETNARTAGMAGATTAVADNPLAVYANAALSLIGERHAGGTLFSDLGIRLSTAPMCFTAWGILYSRLAERPVGRSALFPRTFGRVDRRTGISRRNSPSARPFGGGRLRPSDRPESSVFADGPLRPFRSGIRGETDAEASRSTSVRPTAERSVP